MFQVALIFPLFLNGWSDFIPSPSSNFDYEKNSGPIKEIADRLRPYRLIFDNSHMSYPVQIQGKKYFLNYPQNAACALKIKNFSGYNPLILQAKKEIGTLGMEPLICWGAIKGILTQQNHGEIPGFKLESFPPFLLYEYQKHISYVYTPSEIQVIPDPQKRLGILSKPNFDLSKKILFSEPPPLRIKNPTDIVMRYQIGKDGVDEQSFVIDLNQESWVLFPEVMYPGWKAWSDGEPIPIFVADHLLRSIYLSAGHHQVEFRFEPNWLRPIQMGLVLWLLITLGFFVLYRKGMRKR